jgi:carbonic anhydrase/acetyltransferase-like protein (isoleucine patch superfamily)
MFYLASGQVHQICQESLRDLKKITDIFAMPSYASPDLSAAAFVAPNATVIGDVKVGPEASIWYGAVVRGDLSQIEIGARSNVQDGAVLHGDLGQPTVLEADVTVGHRAVIHGAHIEAGCLIGIGAIVLSGVRVGTGSIVGAGALVSRDVAARSVVMGLPAKVMRTLSDAEVADLLTHAAHYVELAQQHAATD